MNKHKTAWYISLFWICLGISWPFLVSVFIVRNCFDVGQPQADTFLEIPEAKTVSTTFVANHDYLNIIILNLKNPGLANQREYQFLLKQGDKSLVERSFSGFNVGDPSSVRFQFEPIAGSKNTEFTLAVKSLAPSEPRLGIAFSQKAGLSFSAYYRNLDKKLAAVNYLGHLANIFISDWPFFVFWLSLLSLILWLKKISF